MAGSQECRVACYAAAMNTTPNILPPAPGDRDRARGALLGLAIGDAVGTTLEFRTPGSFEPITDMSGGGPFGLRPGQFTDDTSMALCLAESLVETGRCDPVDQNRRYVQWWRNGKFSSTGVCFDIGGQTRQALEEHEATGKAHCGQTHARSAGNGSLMRLAPVAMAFAGAPEQAIRHAASSSRATHGARECVDACRYFAGLLVGAIQGRPKDELLSPMFTPVPDLWRTEPLEPAIERVAAGSFALKEPPAIRGSGYVVESLEATLWAFHKAADYHDTILRAANLGEDADTTAAIAGQIAGAHYGAQNIPARWLERLAMRAEIEELAERLCHLAGLSG